MRLAPSRLAAPLLVIGLAMTAGGEARAGTTACWFENGAVVAPAAIAGLAGDYVIDLSAPHTLLHETKAQMAGFTETALREAVIIAGQTTPSLPVAVVDLDVRGAGFATPIAGVIGIDVLGRYVVDLSFAPCRLILSPRGAAPAFGPARRLPVTLISGAPTVPAAVSDDRRARAGAFAIDTGSKAAVTLATTEVEISPAGLMPPIARNRAPGRLRALSVGGILVENPSAALAADLPAGLTGTLGTDALSAWRLRLDLAAGVLRLAPGSPPTPIGR